MVDNAASRANDCARCPEGSTMRLVLSFVAILIVAAAVLFLAKQQLDASKGLVIKATPPTATGATSSGGDAGAAQPATLPAASVQIQRNVANEVSRSLEQGMQERAKVQE
jgi:hypothetical protein